LAGVEYQLQTIMHSKKKTPLLLLVATGLLGTADLLATVLTLLPKLARWLLDLGDNTVLSLLVYIAC